MCAPFVEHPNASTFTYDEKKMNVYITHRDFIVREKWTTKRQENKVKRRKPKGKKVDRERVRECLRKSKSCSVFNLFLTRSLFLVLPFTPFVFDHWSCCYCFNLNWFHRIASGIFHLIFSGSHQRRKKINFSRWRRKKHTREFALFADFFCSVLKIEFQVFKWFHFAFIHAAAVFISGEIKLKIDI